MNDFEIKAETCDKHVTFQTNFMNWGWR